MDNSDDAGRRHAPSPAVSETAEATRLAHSSGARRASASLPDGLKREIFRIITSRSFDLVALIHLDSRTFEAVYLGETLPRPFRSLLPRPGATCDFDAFCAEAERHMDEGTRGEYASRISSEFIRSEIQRGGGTYEFTLEEHFDDPTPRSVFRRLLHFSLEEDPSAVLVIESDITAETLRQREKTSLALERAAHDRLILDSIMGGICVLRMGARGDLSVDYFNSYVFEMLGYDPTGLPQTIEEARGTPTEPLFADALSFIHPDDKGYVTKAYLTHRDDESFSPRPYRMFGSDGKPRWIKAVARSGEAKGTDRLFYVAMHDITQEMALKDEVSRQMEDERRLRREADAANAAKTDFLSRMSHDMRTPLNGIIGMTYLARREHDPRRREDCLRKIDTSAKFLLGIINDVLDMAKMESGTVELHPEPYPIEEFNDYVDAVIRPLCEERGIRLVTVEHVASDVWPLADKNGVNQILFNLLSNAVKFTPEGGTITYEVSATKLGPSRISIEHHVTDTGVGMSADFCERLFEPFSQEGRLDTSEGRGTGLGLAIAKGLVDLMGGSISVRSTPGKGTSFTVVLEFETVPTRREGPDEGSKLAQGQGGHSLRGTHVLMCEDHPLNQEIAKSLLEGWGALVDIAEDGREGVEAFERSSPGQYDIILMDVRMPLMDGLEATRAIRSSAREDSASVPIVAMTADAFTEDVRRCLDAGMNAHVSKPLDPDRLFEAVSAWTSPGKRKDPACGM